MPPSVAGSKSSDSKGEVEPTAKLQQSAPLEDLHDDGTIDPVYQAKARILNAAIQEIGMGKYQVRFLS